MTPPTTSAPAPFPAGTRCAVHPVRRAVDRCPVCDRPRCAADADAAVGGGCPVCLGVRAGAAVPAVPVTDLERYVRAALASSGIALLGGVVAAQYVGAAVFAYLTPFVVGVLTGAAAQSAARGSRRGAAAMRVRALACAYAVLGVALGFVLEESEAVFGASAVLPYVAAIVGVALWTLPPKARA